MANDLTSRILHEIETVLVRYEEGMRPGELVQHMVMRGLEHETVAAAIRRGIDNKTLTLGERFSIQLERP